MSIEKLILNRRLFLKCGRNGLATLVGLPYLSSIYENRAFAAELNSKTPLRFICMYHPNGVIQSQAGNNPDGFAFFPKRRSEADFDMANSNLKPLVDLGLKNSTTIIRGVTSRGSGNGHMAGITNFLTGAAIPNHNITKHKPSFDTYLEGLIAKNKSIRSIFMAGNPELDRPLSGSKYNNNLKNALSFDGSGQIRKPQMDQKNIFDQLFSGVGKNESEQTISKRDQLKLSVLDSVKEAREALNRQVNQADKNVLDNYYTRVRELEKRLTPDASSGGNQTASCQINGNQFKGVKNHNPTKNISDLTNVVDNAIEIMALSIACDRVRIFSFMFGGEAAGCRYTHLGVNKHFHNTLSHNDKANNDLAKLHRKVDRYHIGKIGELAKKLSQISEAGGRSALYNSVIVSGSGLATGYNHKKSNIPVLVLGHGGGGIRGGRFKEVSGNQNTTGALYSSLLAGMGATGSLAFGDNKSAIKYSL